MILMAHLSSGALLALLEEPRRRSPTIPAADEPAPSPCTSETAIHDAAALREGHLSPAGIARLAEHVTQCESCRILVALLIRDALEIEATGKPPAASPTELDPK